MRIFGGLLPFIGWRTLAFNPKEEITDDWHKDTIEIWMENYQPDDDELTASDLIVLRMFCAEWFGAGIYSVSETWFMRYRSEEDLLD